MIEILLWPKIKFHQIQIEEENMNNNIAVLWDIQNVLPSREIAGIFVDGLLSYCETIGNRSYLIAVGDWKKTIARNIPSILSENGFELLYIPQLDEKGKKTKEKQQCSDNHGGYNSIIIVNEKYAEYTAEEDKIFTFGLINRRFPNAEYIAENLIRFNFRAYQNNLQSVWIEYADKKYEMHKYFSESYWDYYSQLISDVSGIQDYDVILKKGTHEQHLINFNSSELSGKFSIKKREHFLSTAQKGIIYQIFCDRFCNADKSLNPDFKEWYYNPVLNSLSSAAQKGRYRLEEDWNDSRILQKHPDRHYVFYGGDLKGAIEKLDYLHELGITQIYFNPLVKGESNHKYDAFDYQEIEPHLGGNQVFKELVIECHKIGISVILDFAFNHTGVGFFAFQDCLKNGENSKYYNWYDWYKFPLPQKIPQKFDASKYYQCWWGHATLPDLNYDLKRFHPDENAIKDISKAEVNEPLVEHILQVAQFWLAEMDIDGFRLDVPNEVPFWFWELFKSKVKSIKPTTYLVGEIWHNAEEWAPKYFDAVMNYTYFREPVLQYFALQSMNTQQFTKLIMAGLHNYGFYNLSLMMNLIGCHDTYRFLEACGGDHQKLKLTLIFQMTWIGIPHIYYGDEIGMLGAGDPDNRRPMNWNYTEEPESVELQEFIKKLIEIRKNNPELVLGEIEIKELQDDILCYVRTLKKDKIMVIINNSADDVKVKNDFASDVINLIDGKRFSMNQDMMISAYSGVILKSC